MRIKQLLTSKKIWVVNGVIFIMLLPLIAHALIPKVKFNQFQHQELEIRYGTISPEMLRDMVLSMYSSGMNSLLGRGIWKEPSFEEKQAVFSFIYSWIPPYAVVYPTEGFYYWLSEINGQKISGNVRIADLDKGKLSFAYFTVPEKDTRLFNITENEGLKIKKINDDLYYVTYKGKRVRFKIPKTARTGPRLLKMLPSEEFVGQIHDESGLKFFLFFNHDTDSFYDVLNEEDGVTDTFEELDTEPYVLAQRSKFIFYHDKDYNRKILVGVHKDNVDANNEYDGPQDQVPFRAKVRDLTHIAYPNTMLGDGIDEYGVYLNRKIWSRNAISPFFHYRTLDDLYKHTLKWHSEKTKSMLWTGITKEWWNNPRFLRGIEEKLKKEGKVMPVSKWLAIMEERQQQKPKHSEEVSPKRKK